MSAQRSRNRKKNLLIKLEKENFFLKKEKNELYILIKNLREENNCLKFKISKFEKNQSFYFEKKNNFFSCDYNDSENANSEYNNFNLNEKFKNITNSENNQVDFENKTKSEKNGTKFEKNNFLENINKNIDNNFLNKNLESNFMKNVHQNFYEKNPEKNPNQIKIENSQINKTKNPEKDSSQKTKNLEKSEFTRENLKKKIKGPKSFLFIICILGLMLISPKSEKNEIVKIGGFLPMISKNFKLDENKQILFLENKCEKYCNEKKKENNKIEIYKPKKKFLKIFSEREDFRNNLKPMVCMDQNFENESKIFLFDKNVLNILENDQVYYIPDIIEIEYFSEIIN